MPNIKSAIKRVNVSSTKNLRNRMVKSRILTTVKKLNQAAAAGEKQNTEALLRETVSMFDKACAKGIMHKNTANRKKAKMARIAAKSGQ